MPEYLFLNKETGEETLVSMTISERTKYLEDNPHIEQLVYGCPRFGHAERLETHASSKPDKGFQELLRKMDKDNGETSIERGRLVNKGTKINTF